MVDHVLRCQSCGVAHDPSQSTWACPCGGLLDVEMSPCFPLERFSQRPPGLWRYREALAVSGRAKPVSLGEPQTPLVEADRTPCRTLLKLDYLFPTGSFKDRGASVLLTQSRELGVTFLIEDSSGNAGAAIAAYAAASGVRAKVFVPATASTAKTALITAYGAELVKVPGTRANTSQAAWDAAQGAYYASHVWNPYFLEGTKTIAFEIWEQMGRTAPDWVITPVGHGTMLLGVAIGFRQLQQAGLVTVLPRIVGVQAAACAPLVQAFGSRPQALSPTVAAATAADGIAIDQPVRWRQILQAVTESHGRLIGVSEEAIEDALVTWARRGWLMEPTSATALAAYAHLAADHCFAATDTVVVPITGSGSKSTSRFLT
jgi:threonine synthase